VDEFCQYKTIWKVVAIAGHILGLKPFKLRLPETAIAEHREFLKRWPGVSVSKLRSVTELRDQDAESDGIKAGEGLIFLS
jgi:hypothetical protein